MPDASPMTCEVKDNSVMEYAQPAMGKDEITASKRINGIPMSPNVFPKCLLLGTLGDMNEYMTYIMVRKELIP